MIHAAVRVATHVMAHVIAHGMAHVGYVVAAPVVARVHPRTRPTFQDGELGICANQTTMAVKLPTVRHTVLDADPFCIIAVECILELSSSVRSMPVSPGAHNRRSNTASRRNSKRTSPDPGNGKLSPVPIGGPKGRLNGADENATVVHDNELDMMLDDELLNSDAGTEEEEDEDEENTECLLRPDLWAHIGDPRNLLCVRDWETGGLDRCRNYDPINPSPTVEFYYEQCGEGKKGTYTPKVGPHHHIPSPSRILVVSIQNST